MKNRRVLLSVALIALSCLSISAQADVVLSLGEPKLPTQFNGGLFDSGAELKLFACKAPSSTLSEADPLKPGCAITIDDVFYDHIAFLVITKDSGDEYAALRSIQMIMSDGSETYMQFSREHKFEFSGAARVRDLRNTGFTWE